MKSRVYVYGLLLAILPLSLFAESLDSFASKNMLPNDYAVYTQGSAVVNHPVSRFEKKVLPTNNDFTGNPGCYVACYSHDLANGVYSVADNIFVNGQVRVPGEYVGRVCKPTSYENADISKEQHFNDTCGKITTCKDGKCWAGDDTGGWFGIQ